MTNKDIINNLEEVKNWLWDTYVFNDLARKSIRNEAECERLKRWFDAVDIGKSILDEYFEREEDDLK